MDFCELVRTKRKESFKTAKAFFDQAQLTCSYYYYCKIEQDTVPDISVALEIIDALKLNRKSSLFTWLRDQMPDAETKSYFSPLDTQETLSTEQLDARRSLILNRMQAKLLSQNPLYFELVLYVFCHFGIRHVSVDEIETRFQGKKEDLGKFLDQLYEYGILEKTADGLYTSKEWIYIPPDGEFKELREINFKRAVTQFYHTQAGTRLRTTVTRFLTPAQQRHAEALATALYNAIIDMPELSHQSDAEPFTLGVFGSRRRFGDA